MMYISRKVYDFKYLDLSDYKDNSLYSSIQETNSENTDKAIYVAY